jgi:hypothetical protein
MCRRIIYIKKGGNASFCLVATHKHYYLWCDLNDLKIWFSFLDMCDTIIHVLTLFNCDELELSSLPVLKYYIERFHFAYLQLGCDLGSSAHTLSYASNIF